MTASQALEATVRKGHANARRGVSLLAALAANGLVLLGLLFGGWPVWTVLGSFWLELVLETPFLAYRIRRALPQLPAEEREAYLRVQDRVHSFQETVGELIRTAWAERGPEAGGTEAARQFLEFWLPALTLGPGLFLVIYTWPFGIEIWPPALGPLAIVAAGVVAGELVTLWIERGVRPAIPDTRAFERRFVVISITVILLGFVVAIFGRNAAVVAVVFVGLKTVADIRSGYLPVHPVPPIQERARTERPASGAAASGASH